MLNLKSSKLSFLSIFIWLRADSTRASAFGSPYLICNFLSKEPAFTPTLIGVFVSFAADITSLIFSSLPIFPGLILMQSAPPLIASRAIM